MRPGLTGPAIVQAVVDPNEPPLPGNVSLEQTLQFVSSMAHGEKDRWDIIKNVLKEKCAKLFDRALSVPWKQVC